MRSRVSLTLLLAAAPAAAQSPPAEVTRGEGPSGTAGAGDARYDAVGYASWYGEELNGNRTATGERFDPAAITAAHRTLPLGSYAEVTDLDSGRTIVVRVNDRGPSRKDREIDLSRGAATLLGSVDNSVAAVRVRGVVPSPADVTALRAGRAASERLDAPPILLTALRKTLRGYRTPATIVPRAASPPQTAPKPREKPVGRIREAARGRFVVQVAAFSSEARAKALADRLDGSVLETGALWRVRLGPFADRAGAQRARDGAARQGYGDAQILDHP